MSQTVTQIQVFVSCPGDVEREKAAVKRICERINQMMAELNCDVSLVVKDWRDIVGSYGERPQAIINETFREYDIYLGILHMRFGSPTGAINPTTGEDFGSGTIEEFTNAFDRWKHNPADVKVYMFFKQPTVPQDSRATQQLLKVQEFREQISSTGWTNPCADMEDFKEKAQHILSIAAHSLCHKKKGYLKTETLDKLSLGKHEAIDITAFSKDVEVPASDSYIPRTITALRRIQYTVKAWLRSPAEDENESLQHIVLQQKRVALLGSAGSGKSTELSKLILACQQSEIPFIPVYRRFNTYVAQEIVDFLPEGWEKIPASICMVVLDGLDEVQPQHFFTAVRNIELFSLNNPEVTIVVSCRTNFYQLPNSGTTTLAGFETFVLDDITAADINDYVKEQDIANAEQFIQNSYAEGYQDLVGKPFFLKLLLEAFKQYSSLEGNRRKLFEFIIQSRIKLDETHFNNSIPLANIRKIIVSVLERVALVMEAIGVNIISYDQIQEILPVKYMELLRYFPGFSKTKSDENLWGFEHNNIQEYLAARALSSESIDKIKEFIGIPPGYNKIKVSWANTLSFLFSLIENTDLLEGLLDWILEAEPDLIIRFEPSRVSNEVRMHLFTQIFGVAKERNIWIRSSKFSEKDLANFVESPDSFEFLLQQISDKANTRIVHINALRILRYFHLTSLQQTLLKGVIYDLCESSAKDFELLHVLLYVVRDLFPGNKDILDNLMKRFGNYTNQYVRAGFYSLLLESPYINQYVDYLIDGVGISQYDDQKQRTGVTLADESWNLRKAFEKITEPEALEKIILFFANITDRRHINYYDRPDVMAKVIENAVDGYESDKKIYDAVLTLFSAHGRYSNRGTLEIIRPFFDNTHTRLQAFKDIWKRTAENEKLYEKRILLLNIANKEAVDYIMKEHAIRNVTNDDVQTLYRDMNYYRVDNRSDKELIEYFEKRILSETAIDISQGPVVDYQARQKERNQESFNLLFDRAGFEGEIKRLYEELAKEAVGFNDLWEFSRNNYAADAEDYFARCVLDLLRDWTRNTSVIEMDEVLRWLNEGGNFDNFAMNEAVEHLKNYHEIVVSHNQKAMIETWSNKAIEHVLVNDLVTVHGERSFSVNGSARLVWFFLKHLHIQLPKEKLLNFTQFIDVDKRDGELSELGILEEVLSKDEIAGQVIRNLLGSLRFSIAWRNNAVYAISHSLHEAYPGIIAGIKNSSIFLNDRLEVERAYFEKTKDRDTLLDIFKNSSVDETSWLAADLWNKNKLDLQVLISFLKSVMHSKTVPKEYNWKAAEQLIELGDSEAFYYYTDDLLGGKLVIRDSPHRLMVLSQIKNAAMVPRLMELLAFAKQPEYANNVFRSFDNIIISALKAIAMQSASNLKVITTELRKFIDENPDIPNIQFLHLQVEQIEYDYYQQQSQNYKLTDVLSEVEKIRPLDPELSIIL